MSFRHFQKHGFGVDFVSEIGKFGGDEHFLPKQFLGGGQDRMDFETKSSVFNKALTRIKKPKEISVDNYQIYFCIRWPWCFT